MTDLSFEKLEMAVALARQAVVRVVRLWTVAANDPDADASMRVRLAADIEAAQDDLARAEERRDDYQRDHPSTRHSISHWGSFAESRF